MDPMADEDEIEIDSVDEIEGEETEPDDLTEIEDADLDLSATDLEVDDLDPDAILGSDIVVDLSIEVQPP